MRKIFIPIIILIVVLLVSYIYFNRGSKELIVGTAPTLPPFTYIAGEDGSDVVGFDIELARTFAKGGSKDMQLQVMFFQDLLPSVANGTIDMAISVITIRDDRKKIVDFSEPYYSDAISVLVRKDDLSFEDIHTKEELSLNKKIGTQAHTLTADLLSEMVGDDAFLFRTWDEAVSELLRGRVDAIIMNGAGARNYASKNDKLTTLSHIKLESIDYGVAVKKGNAKLLNSINKTLDSLHKSGEYDKLVEEYMN